MLKAIEPHEINELPSGLETVLENKGTGIKLLKNTADYYFVSYRQPDNTERKFWPFVDVWFFDTVWNITPGIKNSHVWLFSAKIVWADLEWAYLIIDFKNWSILTPVLWTNWKREWNFIQVYWPNYVWMNVFTTNWKDLGKFDDFKAIQWQSWHMMWIEDIRADKEGYIKKVTRFNTQWDAFSIRIEKWVNDTVTVLEIIR